MREETQGKTAVFIVLFFMSLILHVQFPVFTPYAVALGATGVFVSIMLSASSLTNLVGHIAAGPYIDRIGKKPFIVIPLFLSALLMIGYALVHDRVQLFVLRVINGFILAFISPACFALLSAYAKNSRQQGKNMAVNGLMVTAANIIAPFIGGRLVEWFAYRGTYWCIGTSLFLTGLIALFYVREADPIVVHRKTPPTLLQTLGDRRTVPVYFIAFTLMYGHGTLFYELPFLTVERGLSAGETGTLFSMMGLGTLASLSLFWLNRFSAVLRTGIGLFFTGLLYYQLAAAVMAIGFKFTLFLMGIAFGLVFPALTTWLAEKTDQGRYGSAFGILSAVFSLGMITATLTSGMIRHTTSPYFPAFLVTMAGAVYLIYDHFKTKAWDEAIKSS